MHISVCTYAYVDSYTLHRTHRCWGNEEKCEKAEERANQLALFVGRKSMGYPWKKIIIILGLCGQYLYSLRISFLFCVHVNVPSCKCVFVHISWCICANAYKYLCISLSVFVCVLVFVHLAQGLVQVEAAIIPSNDYY